MDVLKGDMLVFLHAFVNTQCDYYISIRPNNASLNTNMKYNMLRTLFLGFSEAKSVFKVKWIDMNQVSELYCEVMLHLSQQHRALRLLLDDGGQSLVSLAR